MGVVRSAGAEPEEAMDTETEVLSAIEAMTSAFNRGDIDAVMQTYEPGAVVLGEPGAPVRGDAPLRAMFAGFTAAKALFTFDGHEVIAAGDIALHVTPWKMTALAPDGRPIHGSGLSLAVLRRQPDGRWLMVIDNPFGDAILKRVAPTHTEKNLAP
jgi:ketosteroid isomerase-like protein